MAKLALLGTTLPPRRSYGVVNTTLAGNAVARGFSMPVLPRTPSQAGGTITVAQLAALWGTLSAADQALWDQGPLPQTHQYTNFFAFNQNVATWGYPIFATPPTVPINLSESLYFITSGPDGVTTTLTCYGLNTGGSGLESWVQLYLNPSTLSGVPPTNDNGLLYVGKFGPNPPSVPTVYDITGIWAAVVGQWLFPTTFDTTAGKTCGSAIYGQTADTDQYGRAFDLIFSPNPSGQYFLGLQGGVPGPGACFGHPLNP
jgi:hypothetical protein